MKQKVIKIGSSIGVVIPKPVAEELGFQAGQEVTIHPTDKGEINIEHVAPKEKSDPRLAVWLEDAVKRYRPALEALKDA